MCPYVAWNTVGISERAISTNIGTESMLQCSSCVYSAIILSQLSPSVRYVLQVLLATHAFETTLHRSVFFYFMVTCLLKAKRCRTRCLTFSAYFVTRNHTVEILCANFFSSCSCACVHTYICPECSASVVPRFRFV